MIELMEQVQLEHAPAELEDNGKPVVDKWSQDKLFAHFAKMYIRYIEIFRKLEECYDQMLHPQKRQLIKRILETTIIRVCEL